MIIKICSKIRNFDGASINEVNSEGKSSELTLKTIIIEALLRQHTSESKLGGAEKLKRFELARKIHGCKDEVDINIEEAATVKDCVLSKDFPNMIVGLVCEMMEGEKENK